MQLAQLNFFNPRLNDGFEQPDVLVGTLTSRFLVYAIAAAGMYFFVKTVIAGFTYLTSFGDSSKIQAAQTTLVHSLAGLIIVISAFFIGQIIENVFGVNIGI